MFESERDNITAYGGEGFIEGGKGGFLSHIIDDNGNTNRGGLGNAQEGGFGGGAAGGEGGSGGGGGYSGGGSDNISNDGAPQITNNTIAGGGGSIVNSKVLAYNPTIQSQVTKNDDTNINNFNGYIKIQFNPYNKININ